jgi:pimeloyl-ACP methyl ester carboxylesterase
LPGFTERTPTIDAERTQRDVWAEMPIRETSLVVGRFHIPIREAGPEGGELVVLLHGFPDCLYTYDSQLESLAREGYRAVAPALRGYASTAIPRDGDYHLVTLAHDVVALLDALGVRRAHLVGHDWGAVIGWLAIATHPERFLSFASLAIPPLGGMARALLRYPTQLRKSWYMMFFQLRGVSDRVLARDDFAFIERLWRDWSPGWSCPPSTMERVKETFRQPGVPGAALGYYRCLFEVTARANRRAQKRIGLPIHVPVLALHGENDGCMDSRLPHAALSEDQFCAGIELATLRDAGHFLHQEQPAKVNARLIAFLASAMSPMNAFVGDRR